jgi:hypothetical protein
MLTKTIFLPLKSFLQLLEVGEFMPAGTTPGLPRNQWNQFTPEILQGEILAVNVLTYENRRRFSGCQLHLFIEYVANANLYSGVWQLSM